jgi:zinc transport system substrate-binding protein
MPCIWCARRGRRRMNTTPNSPLKKGDRHLKPIVFRRVFTCRFGASPLFQQAANGPLNKGDRHLTPIVFRRVFTCRFGASPLFQRAANRIAWPICASIVGLLLLAGCEGHSEHRQTDGRLPVFVGIPPLAYLAEQIGGRYVAVDVLVQPGQDPHTFEPTPHQALALSRTKVFFQIGMPFENAILEKVRQGNRRLIVVDAARGVEKRMMDGPCCQHSAGHEHGHDEPSGDPDPHVWLSPPLLKIEAENVAVGLCEADPAHKEEYRQNLAALLGRIEAAHRRIGRLLAPYRGRSFLVFHPGFGYFADAYGLKELAVEAGGRQPAPKQLRALIETAKAEGIGAVFVQPEFDPHSAQVVAEAIGGRVVVLNGLAKDVLQDLEEIAGKIETAMRQKAHGEDK